MRFPITRSQPDSTPASLIADSTRSGSEIERKLQTGNLIGLDESRDHFSIESNIPECFCQSFHLVDQKNRKMALFLHFHNSGMTW